MLERSCSQVAGNYDEVRKKMPLFDDGVLGPVLAGWCSLAAPVPQLAGEGRPVIVLPQIFVVLLVIKKVFYLNHCLLCLLLKMKENAKVG